MEKGEKKKSSFTRKALYIVIPLFVILLGWFGWMIKEKYFPEKAIHYHAGFIVIKDNNQVDFSDIHYMHEKPCGKNDHEEQNAQEEQIEKAHLHDYVGDVVHIHRSGVIWKDLFTNLKYPLDYATTTAYLNGKQVSNFQNQPIRPYDSLILFIGKNEIKKQLHNAVKKDYIKTIEQKSDNCGTS